MRTKINNPFDMGDVVSVCGLSGFISESRVDAESMSAEYNVLGNWYSPENLEVIAPPPVRYIPDDGVSEVKLYHRLWSFIKGFVFGTGLYCIAKIIITELIKNK